MPLDERLAWGYTIVQYTTPAANHRLSFSHREVTSAGAWANPDGYTAGVYAFIVEILNTFNVYLNADTVIGDFVVYQNNPSPAPATFVFADSIASGDWIGGDGGFHPSSQVLVTLKTPTNRVAKLSFIDGIPPEPQRYLFSSLGATLRANITTLLGETNWQSIDGEALTRCTTVNYGYNNRLKKKYGRTLAP